MTDTGAALWLLVLTLLASACVNLTLVASLIRPWWVGIQDRANGPKTVILRGTMRRRVISLVLHAALIVQFGTRVLTGHAAAPLQTTVVVLVLVLALAADAIGDLFDYRLLRGLLKERE